jgi:hypothetical protein
MSNDRNNPEHIRITGGFAANTASIATASLTSPTKLTYVEWIHTRGPAQTTPPAATVTKVSPTFKLVCISVLIITGGSGLADVAVAYAWPLPTGNQQAVFDAFNFAWKAGIRAIFGLLGGKAT